MMNQGMNEGFTLIKVLYLLIPLPPERDYIRWRKHHGMEGSRPLNKYVHTYVCMYVRLVETFKLGSY